MELRSSVIFYLFSSLPLLILVFLTTSFPLYHLSYHSLPSLLSLFISLCPLPPPSIHRFSEVQQESGTEMSTSATHSKIRTLQELLLPLLIFLLFISLIYSPCFCLVIIKNSSTTSRLRTLMKYCQCSRTIFGKIINKTHLPLLLEPNSNHGVNGAH